MVTEAEARRIRPMMSGIVALAVALVTAIGWYYIGRPDESQQPVQTVEWQPWVKAGKADHKLLMLAPSALPEGWRATSANYVSGVSPHWHLGMLTGTGKFVGVDEARDTVADMVETYVDANAVKGDDVEINGLRWQTWTDDGGDYALVQTFVGPDGNQENVVVVGSAADAQIRAFVASLNIAQVAKAR
ncbi:DUF4245 family protein [Nocardioides marmorisolisilvae]|uniref:DUF4245 family protein n=1 Tax=Nocardioides marmorisolisilvae TaxID=1542737 RepID=A0A3N0DZ20_9ACTN|nr:DUF4245 family protein [Nocardioides marmorisolisilvae]RNL80858.1 DUF4245 family protein [Nocardioides marmorisolisilvae]